jgi:hypothetical protein
VLTTGPNILTAEQALAFGHDMASKRIDGHFKGGADRLHEVGQKKKNNLDKEVWIFARGAQESIQQAIRGNERS